MVQARLICINIYSAEYLFRKNILYSVQFISHKRLDKLGILCYNTYRKKEIRKELISMNKYNLNRIERHYMIEVMLTFEEKHGREMTDAEYAAEVEKMRARRAR